jgi:predicted nuclease of restriction endonuclease-like (RecB) superfamily
METDLEKINPLVSSIATLIQEARKAVYHNSNSILLQLYWHIGKLIVEDEQGGNAKAVYGKAVLKNIARQLTLEFGKGFDERNLNNIRAFYLAFPIWNELRTELSWTHYRIICRVKDHAERLQYMNHSIEGNWSTKSLQRNIQTGYVNRILDTTTQQPNPESVIKDPYIFEFLGLLTDTRHTEHNIEMALINHLQQFLMELGKGFAFVARQQHIVTDTADFFIDLVFYNYYLKCFVLIDLKTHPLNHQAIGQMDMYVRMYNDLKKSNDDNPTIGLILCSDKDETIVKYSVLAENEKLFASKYRLYLPREEDLKQLIDADKVKFNLDNE